jgi:amidase
MNRWNAGQAATLAQLGMVLGREIGPGDVEPLTWAMAQEGKKVAAPDYLAAVGAHQALGRMWGMWFAGDHDLIVTPTLGELPTPLGTFDDSGADPMRAIVRARTTAGFVALLNGTGQPAISIPLHWTEDGLPVGVQLVAAMGREDLLIRVAAQLEQARPWADRRPPVWAGADPTPA